MKKVLRIRASERRARPARYGGATVATIADPLMAPVENLRFGISTLAPGSAAALHYHSVEAIEYILSGRAVVIGPDGERMDMEPGDAVVFAPGPDAAHAWEYLGPEPCVILWMHAGPGEDQVTWLAPPAPPQG
jgi:gentisate 1,2-dioxygenase